MHAVAGLSARCQLGHLSFFSSMARVEVAPASLSKCIAMQPSHIWHLLHHCDLSEAQAEELVAELHEVWSLDCGTDGGLLAGEGTHGFAWAAQRVVLSQEHGHIPGAPLIMSSTCAELCGILVAITHLWVIVEHCHVVLPSDVWGHICCDSKAALHRIKDLHCEGFGATWHCRAHCDLEAAVRSCCQHLSFSRLDWHWVRGHASRLKAQSEFAWQEVLDDQADVLATKA